MLKQVDLGSRKEGLYRRFAVIVVRPFRFVLESFARSFYAFDLFGQRLDLLAYSCYDLVGARSSLLDLFGGRHGVGGIAQSFDSTTGQELATCDAWAFLTYKSVRGFMLAGVLGITEQ